MTEQKSEWRNDSAGVIGVVLFNEKNEAKGAPVLAGESVWLSERERVATANAPKSADDNPLTNGDLVLVTAAQDVIHRRPIGPDEPQPGPAPEPEAPAEPEAAPEVASDQEKAKEAAARTTQPPVPPDRPQGKATAEVKATPAAEQKAASAPAPEGQRAGSEQVATPAATKAS